MPGWTSTPATRWSRRIKPLAQATHRPGVMGGIGGFGALFDLRAAGFTDPVLVATTDGVGTKLLVAIETGQHARVGHRPGGDVRQRPRRAGRGAAVLPGLFRDRQALRRAGARGRGRHRRGLPRRPAARWSAARPRRCPASTRAGHYDLAGFAVGAAEREALLPREVAPGDAVLGLPVVRRAFQRLLAGAADRRGVGPRPGTRRRRSRPGRALGRGAAGADAHLRRPRCWRCIAPGCCTPPPTSPAAACPAICRACCRPTRGRARPRRLDAAAGVRLARRGRRRGGGRDAARVQLRDRHGAGGARRRAGRARCLRTLANSRSCSGRSRHGSGRPRWCWSRVRSGLRPEPRQGQAPLEPLTNGVWIPRPLR